MVCFFVLPKGIKKLKDELAILLTFYFENFPDFSFAGTVH